MGAELLAPAERGPQRAQEADRTHDWQQRLAGQPDWQLIRHGVNDGSAQVRKQEVDAKGQLQTGDSTARKGQDV